MNIVLLFLNTFISCYGTSMDYIVESSLQDEESNPTDDYRISPLSKLSSDQETVKIQLYYESLCPYSKEFYVQELYGTFLKIGNYLDIKIYPYGNAQTVKRNGIYEFHCQHGPEECYGNMLNACAIKHMGSHNGMIFNACMMEGDSDDQHADECGKNTSTNVRSIKECAKGQEGIRLLKEYGDESKIVGFHHVPYVLINGEELHWDGSNFMENVCAAFKQPPIECQ